MTVQSPAPAPSAPSRPRGSVGAAPRRRRPGRLAAATTPTLLRILMIILLLASLAWGAVGAWAVNQHASAAQNVVSTSEPLSLGSDRLPQRPLLVAAGQPALRSRPHPGGN